MGNDTISARSNGQTIDETWFNVLRSVLAGDYFPRNSSGVVTDQAGSFGSNTYQWLHAYLAGGGKLYWSGSTNGQIYYDSARLRCKDTSGSSEVTLSDLIPLRTITGTALDATTLGTFTGSLITDNLTIKAALQELETTIETSRAAYNRSWSPSNQYVPSSASYTTRETFSITTVGKPVRMFLTYDLSNNNIDVKSDWRILHNDSATLPTHDVTEAHETTGEAGTGVSGFRKDRTAYGFRFDQPNADGNNSGIYYSVSATWEQWVLSAGTHEFKLQGKQEYSSTFGYNIKNIFWRAVEY